MAKLTKGFFEGTGRDEGVRVNKYLSDAGVCSRREADELVAAGKVLIDGMPAVMGSRILPGQKVMLDGKELEKDSHMVLIAFNKPQGIVCTTDRREPDNIIDFINYGSRIFPIGRLDKDSEGLILLTNDGEIVNKILRAGNGHEKEYVVQVNKPLTTEFLNGMAGGVPILDTVTKPCLVEQLDKMTFRIVLTQGLNRQIRRMCEYFDYRVRALQRVRVMNINLGRLKTGTYRNLTDWELEELNRLIVDSSNAPASKAGAREKGNMPPEGIAIVKKPERRPAKKRDLEGKVAGAAGKMRVNARQNVLRTADMPGKKPFGKTEDLPQNRNEVGDRESARPKTWIKGEGWTKKKEDRPEKDGGGKKNFRAGAGKADIYSREKKEDFRHGNEGEDLRGRERKDSFRRGKEKEDLRGRERKENFRRAEEKEDPRGRERKENFRRGKEKEDPRGRERKENFRRGKEKEDPRGRERKERFRSRQQEHEFSAGNQKESFKTGNGRKIFPAGQKAGKSRTKK